MNPPPPIYWYWAMHLVISCGSNSYPSYVVNLLYIWPLESFICKCVVQLLVSSLIKCLLFYFLSLLIKKTHLRCFITSCLMASMKLEIFVFSHTLNCLLSYCPNKMTVLFTTVCVYHFAPALARWKLILCSLMSHWKKWRDRAPVRQKQTPIFTLR